MAKRMPKRFEQKSNRLQLLVRLTSDERSRLDSIVKARGISFTAFVREAIDNNEPPKNCPTCGRSWEDSSEDSRT